MIPILTMPVPTQEAASAREVAAAVLLVIGIVLIAILFVMHVWAKLAIRRSNRPTAREQIDRVKAGAGIGNRRSAADDDEEVASAFTTGKARRAAQGTAAGLDDVRHIAALLDNKAERLEQLLAEANDRIARLEALASGPSRANTDESPENEPVRSDNRADSPRQRDAPASDPLTRSVYEMADNGHDSVSIAQKLDEQVGKIDLILALRRQGN